MRTAEQTAEMSLLTAVEVNDTSTIATVSATLGGLHGLDIQARAVVNAAFYAVLTTDQQTKCAQFLEHGALNERPGGPPRH